MTDRYSFEQDTMEPNPNGEWVAYDDVAHLMQSMTLRDMFASQVSAGVFMQVYSDKSAKNEPAHELHKLVAQASYKIADAMLAERAK
jgi:hypothetical protein